MAHWFTNFPATIKRQGKVLLAELKEDGNVPVGTAISRYAELVPEDPNRRYWEPCRRELGRILRLISIESVNADKEAAEAAARAKAGDDEDDDADETATAAAAAAATRKPSTRKRSVFNIEKEMTATELVQFMMNRNLFETGMIKDVSTRIAEKVNEVNDSQRRLGLAELDAYTTKVNKVVDADWLMTKIKDFCNNAVTSKQTVTTKRRAAPAGDENRVSM
jgi:hypothetical protein